MCSQNQNIEDYVHHRISGASLNGLFEHVAHCPECQLRLYERCRMENELADSGEELETRTAPDGIESCPINLY